MANSCSLKLKQISDASSVKLSAVPLFICDEDLRICTKSAGAERLIPKPRIKSSMEKYFPAEDLSDIRSGSARIYRAAFSDGDTPSEAFVCRGEIEGEVYYGVIVKLNIGFCPYPYPPYLNEACGQLADAVKELLFTEYADHKKLEVCCMRISRLCDFRAAERASAGFSHINISNINSVMEALAKESSATLTSIGGSAEFVSGHNSLWTADISSKELYILLSTIIVSMVTLSSRGKVKVSFAAPADESEIGEISVLTDSYAAERGVITSFDELALAAVPLSLEIKALKAMTEAMGVEAVCKCVGTTLEISLRFATRRVGDMVLHAPTYMEDRRFLAKLLSELCLIAS